MSALRLAALAGWTALLASWSLIFVPALFGHLSATGQIAELVGATLERVDQAGALLGVVALAAGSPLAASGLRARGFAWLPVFGVACHLASWLWIAPEIREIREAAGGTIGLLAPEDPQIARFQTLHTVSFGVFLLTGLVALVSTVHATVDLVLGPLRIAKKFRNA